MRQLWWLNVLVFTSFSKAIAEEYEIPAFLDECYSKAMTTNNFTVETKSNCLQKYLVNTFGKILKKNLEVLDEKALHWIESLGKSAHSKLSRGKRDIPFMPSPLSVWHRTHMFYRPIPGRRIRKEIRTLSRKERKDFFDAINALKNDRSVSPNRYDAIALLHIDETTNSAHFGPNFVGWHRYYLFIFEEALRSKNPNCALPYWDSRLDFRMNNPVESVLFSDMFLGNPSGVVVSGPFANWITPGYPPNVNVPLRRGAPGPNSSLINPELLLNVWRQMFNYQILQPEPVSRNSDIEHHHNGVHNWVGGMDGHMAGLNTSPQDPIFFLLHCFIDYIWEVFRRGQRLHGIDPETDYPNTTIPEHLPYRLMDKLTPPQTNIFGYSNFFTKFIYTYAPAPRCSNRCGAASGLYLFCNINTYSCQSRSRQEFGGLGGFERDWVSGFSAIVNTAITASSPRPNIFPRFPTGAVDIRTIYRRF